ncbi:hypothetical protein [Candidatus Raskinella chloraquaticus]|uniref:hypothetical protein n=1 Tax=Candidatus Raskinella chloraquaticus TaxID=1951219 RepID=UPI00366E2C1B
MQNTTMPSQFTAKRALIGFLAAFLGTVTVHQLVIAALPFIGINAFPAYSLRPTAPLGVPLFLSLAFWAGVWGIAYVFIADRLPKSINPMLAGALFGVLLPTLAGWTVIAAMKGQPLFSGFNPERLAAATIANSIWGASIPLFCNWLSRVFPNRT